MGAVSEIRTKLAPSGQARGSTRAARRAIGLLVDILQPIQVVFTFRSVPKYSRAIKRDTKDEAHLQVTMLYQNLTIMII